MKVEFLGVGSCQPENAERDTVSLLINGHVMVDTGWHSIHNLLRAGIEPQKITALFFTHMHQDHYLGLPALLFYMLNGYAGCGGLAIYGPEMMEEVVAQALTFAGYERHYAHCPAPRVSILSDGKEVEMDGLKIKCMASRHAVPGFCYKFTDPQNGENLVYTGDTASFPGIAEYAKGSRVLIHESSFGVRETPENNPYCHSSALDAARCAAAAGVEQLYLVHTGEKYRREIELAAREIFVNSICPNAGDIICL